jgi:hypothetical protein
VECFNKLLIEDENHVKNTLILFIKYGDNHPQNGLSIDYILLGRIDINKFDY